MERLPAGRQESEHKLFGRINPVSRICGIRDNRRVSK